jgi:hypothetical protein
VRPMAGLENSGDLGKYRAAWLALVGAKSAR